MAAREDFSWPRVGNSNGRPRGLLLAAYEDLLMAVVRNIDDRPDKARRMIGTIIAAGGNNPRSGSPSQKGQATPATPPASPD